jgi:glycosyltransferase involved in cell wall biosynthesis
MPDGAGGVLGDDTEECARAIIDLIGDVQLRRELGESGRRRVQEQFLITRLLRDELAMLEALVHGRAVTSTQVAEAAASSVGGG